MQSETGTHKVSDSGYSNSYSNNSQSQRSDSGKSRNSGSNSSRSSGYCVGGHPPTNNNTEVYPNDPKPISKWNKEKDTKNKKLKNSVTPLSENVDTIMENVSNNPPAITETAEPSLPDVQDVQAWPTSSPKDIDADTAPTADENVELQIAAEIKPKSPASDNAEQSDNFKTINEPGDGFYCVISMHDGVVLYTTPNLTNVLGFPQDMWLGRSFIDFVHPKDRVTFGSHITADVAIPLAETEGQIKESSKNSLYVSLRKYRGLRTSGFGVIENAVSFKPFHLSLVFKEIKPQPSASLTNKGLYLIVSATPLHSPYKIPDEPFLSSKFCVRHTASCEISFVDPDVVTNFGFLPQDMIGHSIFEFLHPEDMPFLKDVYKTVMEKAQISGSVFRSKPYRFLTQNGSFVTIETDWSCFINPWARKLEFVIGHHRIIQGPHNPEIFDAPRSKSNQFPNEVVTKSTNIQGEIRYLLVSELPRPNCIAKQQVSKRCQDLASFMATLMDDVTHNNQINVNVSPQDVHPTFSEWDSAMLGEISPHHDYYDSKSSSETPPPSYNQLNYNENMQRFFESKPNTRAQSDTSGERVTTTSDMDVDRKSVEPDHKHLSPLQTSGDSGSGSADNSSGSNPKLLSRATTSNSLGKQPKLTKELLYQHNEDMEKIMAKQHRELRSGNKGEKKGVRVTGDKIDSQEHGVKRCGSYSWESDYHKQPKHQHNPDANKNTKQTTAESNQGRHNVMAVPNPRTSTNVQPGSINHQTSNINNIWSPFSIPLAQMPPQMSTTPTIPNATFSATSFPPGGMLFYVPPLGPPSDQTTMPSPFPLHCLSAFHPFYNSSPMMYPQGLAYLPLQIPVTQPQLTPTLPQINTNGIQTTQQNLQTTSTQEPANQKPSRSKSYQGAISQPTSVKAEPGSAIGSIGSHSVANKALSECSKQGLSVQYFNETQMDQGPPAPSSAVKLNTQPEAIACEASGGSLDGESSYSSFYSSFLKTDLSNDNNTQSDNSKDKHSSCSRVYQKKQKTNPHVKRKSTPPWLDAVQVTPELIYQYQMSFKDADTILAADLLVLKQIAQPVLVNDQLEQLYLDLELESLSRKLSLEDGLTTSSSSSEDTSAEIQKQNKTTHKKRRSFSKLVMIYEADAPFPPPKS